MNIGKRFIDLRFKLKKKQSDIAKKIKITSASISSIETGKSNPSLETVLALSKEFNVNIHWLLTGKGSMFIDDKKKEKSFSELIQSLDKSSSIINDLVKENSKLSKSLIECMEKRVEEKFKKGVSDE